MTDNPTPPTPPTPEPGPIPNHQGPPQELIADPADVEKNKIFAVLAYILFLIPLLAAKQSPFARYHTNQGLILFLLWLAGAAVIGIATFICSIVISFCACGGCVLGSVYAVAILAFAVMGIINAANGRMKPLPFIGNFKLIK